MSISITASECKCHKISLAPNHLYNWHSNKHILCITMCNDSNTSQITEISILAYYSLHASFVTSCTSPPCRAMKEPSHYPIMVLVPARHASVYPATSGSSRNNKIWTRYIPTAICLPILLMDTLTTWCMVCCWPHSQTADSAMDHMYRFATHGPWPVWKQFNIDNMWQVKLKPVN